MITAFGLGADFWEEMQRRGLPPNIVRLELSMAVDEIVTLTATWYPPEDLVRGLTQTGRYELVEIYDDPPEGEVA